MFKIGDIVTGVQGSFIQYGITNENTTLKVVGLSPEYYPLGYVTLELLSTTSRYDKDCAGMTFPVLEKFFTLVDGSLQGKTEVEKKIAFMRKRFEERNHAQA